MTAIKRPEKERKTSKIGAANARTRIEADHLREAADRLPSAREQPRFEANDALKLLLEPSFYGAIFVVFCLLVTLPVISLWLALKAASGRRRR